MTMLDRMRRHKGWLKWSLGLVILAFCLFYIPDFMRQDTGAAAAPTDVVATVDGHEITAGEFQKAYRSQLQAYRSAYGGSFNEELIKQMGLDQQILQQMVEEQAALVEARRLGLEVTDAEMRDRIMKMPGLQQNGTFIGEERYRLLLRRQNPPMTVSQFEDNLRKSLLVEKLRATITDWVTVTDAEIEDEYKRRNEKVKLELVTFPQVKYLDQVTVDDGEMAAHFEAHPGDYTQPDKRKVRYLLIDPQVLRAKVNITPQEAEASYKQNIAQHSTPEQVRASHILLKTEGKDDAAVKKLAEELLAKVKAGADFAELANKHSEDEASNTKGGDLDYFGRGRMVPEFEQVAFSLAPGAISDAVVKSTFGYHIIKTVDKKAATVRPFAEVQSQIVEQLKWERAREEAGRLAEEMDAEISKPADIDAAAARHGFKVEESPLFGAAEPVPGLGFSPDVSQRAFKLADGEVTESVGTGQGYAFLTVIEKKASYAPKLDEVKDKVREDVKKAKARAIAVQKATDLAPVLKSAKDFAAAVKAAGLELKTTDLNARNAGVPDIGNSAAFEAVVYNMEKGAVSDPIHTENVIAIAHVVEKEGVTPATFALMKDSLRDEVASQKRQKFYAAYMTKARERMKIDIDRGTVTRAIA